MICLVRQTHTNKKMNRHIQVRYKSIRSMISRNIILLDFVKSELNLADQLTKGLTRSVIKKLSYSLGLSPRGCDPQE